MYVQHYKEWFLLCLIGSLTKWCVWKDHIVSWTVQNILSKGNAQNRNSILFIREDKRMKKKTKLHSFKNTVYGVNPRPFSSLLLCTGCFYNLNLLARIQWTMLWIFFEKVQCEVSYDHLSLAFEIVLPPFWFACDYDLNYWCFVKAIEFVLLCFNLPLLYIFAW